MFPRSKVNWKMPILPINRGVLGLLDPMAQSKALLARFGVRRFLLGDEPWKKLFWLRARNFAPINGGPWVPSYRWIMLT